MINVDLYDVNEWVIIGSIVVLFLCATEMGYVYGIRNRHKIEDPVRSQIITIQAAVLGLLALLLGFSFSMAMTRYDARKQLIVGEANAIGDTYLYAQLLDQSSKEAVSRLLLKYIEARIAFYQGGIDERMVKKTTTATENLQKELWQCAVNASKDDPHAVTIGLFLQSLNNLFDYEVKRLAALENHVPEGIFFLLYFAGILTMGLVGYGFGVGGRRNLLATLLIAIFIASVIFVIIDLDRPRRGMMQVGQQSLIDLQNDIKKYACR